MMLVFGAIDPVFWLGCSLLLVALSLAVLLAALLPAVRELSRAARSAEKLFDTLRREFPPTLEAIRLTGLEISELTDDINEGVNNASDAIKQVDRSLGGARQQVRNVQVGTRSAIAGMQAAWRTFRRGPRRRRPLDALPTSTEDYPETGSEAYDEPPEPLPPDRQTAALESELSDAERPARASRNERLERPDSRSNAADSR